MKRKYAIHPGYIRSIYDHEIHYISGRQLAELYGLKPHEYFIVHRDRPETWRGLDMSKFIHLYPRRKGDYKDAITRLSERGY